MRITPPKPPISLPPNLTLFFTTQSVTGARDPRTGNPVMSTTITTVRAFAFELRRDKDIQEYPGVDQGALFLECYTVEPLVAPDAVKLIGRVQAEIENFGAGKKKAGTFTFLPSAMPFSGDVAGAVGTYFKGYFLGVGG
jgi:hypothetical protein